MEKTITLPFEEFSKLQKDSEILESRTIHYYSRRHYHPGRAWGFNQPIDAVVTHGSDVPKELQTFIESLISVNRIIVDDCDIKLAQLSEPTPEVTHTFLQRLKYLFTNQLT